MAECIDARQSHSEERFIVLEAVCNPVICLEKKHVYIMHFSDCELKPIINLNTGETAIFQTILITMQHNSTQQTV